MLTRWFNCLILGLITLLNFSAGQALAAEKKNVCAMTINSNDEIELFKKHLSPEQFNFIELTETKDKKESFDAFDQAPWLTASCKQGLKCDVLVISGHFGGSFFGSTGISLPLEALEAASCDNACSGILHHPKEVFLFGCNTLAGKERDARTPEQYADVLVADGFSPDQAQQIAAFRYSPFGSSFNSRMSRIFSKVPRIYGFSSIAPSGKRIAPHLSGYLKEVAPTYFAQLTNMKSDANTSLRARLQGQPFVQTEGAEKTNSPVCYIESEKTSTIAKLKYALESLEKGQALELAPYLSKYFKNLNKKNLNPAERRLLEEIFMNSAGREKLAAFVAKPVAGLAKVQVDTLNLMLAINWISENEYDLRMITAVLQPLYSGAALDRATVDRFCSLNVTVKRIDVKRLKADYWRSPNFYSILECLQPRNTEIIESLAENLDRMTKEFSALSPASQNAQIKTFTQITKLLSKGQQLNPRVTQSVLALAANPLLLPSMVVFAEKVNYLDKNFRQSLEGLLQQESMPNLLKEQIKTAILAMSANDTEYINPVLEDTLNGKGTYLSYDFREAMRKSQALQDKVSLELFQPRSVRSLNEALTLVHYFEKIPQSFVPRFLNLATGNYPIAIQQTAFALGITLSDDAASDFIFTKQVLSSQANYQTRLLAILSVVNAGFDSSREMLSQLFSANDNAQIRRIINISQANIDDSKGSAPYHQNFAHSVLKIDTKSQLKKDLNAGLIPYTSSAISSDEKSGFAVLPITIGVKPDSTDVPVMPITTDVLYNLGSKQIVGILSADDHKRPTNIKQVGKAIFISNEIHDTELIHSALVIELDSGKIQQDYSDSILKEQLALITDLKAKGPEYKNFIEENQLLNFFIQDSNSDAINFSLVSPGSKKILRVHGVMELHPGRNGIGTVKFKNLSIQTVKQE